MRVSIDWDLCIGAGRCLEEAGPAFRLVPFEGQLRAIISAPARDDLLIEAARACPTLAIRVVDDQGRQVYPLARFKDMDGKPV